MPFAILAMLEITVVDLCVLSNVLSSERTANNHARACFDDVVVMNMIKNKNLAAHKVPFLLLILLHDHLKFASARRPGVGL